MLHIVGHLRKRRRTISNANLDYPPPNSSLLSTIDTDEMTGESYQVDNDHETKLAAGSYTAAYESVSDSMTLHPEVSSILTVSDGKLNDDMIARWSLSDVEEPNQSAQDETFELSTETLIYSDAMLDESPHADADAIPDRGLFRETEEKIADLSSSSWNDMEPSPSHAYSVFDAISPEIVAFGRTVPESEAKMFALVLWLYEQGEFIHLWKVALSLGNDIN